MAKWKMLALSGICWLSAMACAITPQEIATQLQAQPVIHGQFSQSRYLRGLDTPIVSEGEFSLGQARGLWWHVMTPFDSRLKVGEDAIWQWQDGAWLALPASGSEQIRLFLGILGGDVSRLEGDFQIQAQGSSTQWQLTLTPDSVILNQVFSVIRIAGGKTIERIEIDEVQGDRSVLQFRAQQPGWPDDPLMQPEN